MRLRPTVCRRRKVWLLALRKDIRRLVAYYAKKCGSCSPFVIADFLNIELQVGPLGSRYGCYMFLKNHRCIFLNENLPPCEMNMVMAHELGHAIMHRRENCYFIKNKTLLLNSKTELEANLFAAELLISDDAIREHRDMTIGQLSRLLGYEQEMIQLKMRLFAG